MFKGLINYFFPTPKTMLELAKEKILAQTHAFNGDVEETDFDKDQFFVVGRIFPRKEGRGFESYTVMFSFDDENVAIKQDKTVLYFFSRKEEVLEIRKTLKELRLRG